MTTRFRRRWPSASRAGSRALAVSISACALLGALSYGCASKPGVLFERADADLVWPPPPDTARIAYVGALVTDRDLKPSRSFAEQIGGAIFGREEARGMIGPAAVCVEGAGEGARVFVADPGVPGVHVFALGSREYELWTPGEGARPFATPVGIALDPGGRVIVSDSGRGELLLFDTEGSFLGAMGGASLERPVGVAVAPDGRILVVDTGRHELVVLSPDGLEIERVGGRGSAPGLFNYPTHVAIDHDGHVYISDSLNFRVQVLDADLTAHRVIGKQGDMPGYFSQPKGVGVSRRGVLHVVDANFEAVQLFDGEGRLLMTFGSEGHDPGQFWLPAGIHVDDAGWVWVADSYNRRVQVFRSIDAVTDVEVQP